MSAEAAQVVDQARRDRATVIAERLSELAFKDRKGHGSGPCSYRQMRREELMAFLVTAFESGAEWESRR